jgi:hypothetical protein
MFAKVRDKMRAKIRALDYVMTIHAEEEMESDHLSILDVEEIILTGEIVEKQQDAETQEHKFLVSGTTLDSVRANVVAKLSVTDKLVIITVYLEDDEYEN